MEKIITIICNTLMYGLFLYTFYDYSDFALVESLIVFISLLIFYLIRYKKTYIDIKVIFINVFFFIIDLLILITCFSDKLKGNDYMIGLGGGDIACVYYFIIFAVYLIVLVLINIIKKISMRYKR